jgi:hypothetical protein
VENIIGRLDARIQLAFEESGIDWKFKYFRSIEFGSLMNVQEMARQRADPSEIWEVLVVRKAELKGLACF